MLWYSGGDKSLSRGSVLAIIGWQGSLVLATHANKNVPDTATIKSTASFPNTPFSGGPCLSREPSRVSVLPLTQGELTVPLLTQETKLWVKNSAKLLHGITASASILFGQAACLNLKLTLTPSSMQMLWKAAHRVTCTCQLLKGPCTHSSALVSPGCRGPSPRRPLANTSIELTKPHFGLQ